MTKQVTREEIYIEAALYYLNHRHLNRHLTVGKVAFNRGLDCQRLRTIINDIVENGI